MRKGRFGTGVFATADIKEGTNIINVPRESQITLEHVIKFFTDNFKMNPVTELDGLDCLSLYVAIATKTGSPFTPYLDALPRTFTTLLENWPMGAVPYLATGLRETYNTNVEDREARWARVQKVYDSSNKPSISEAEFHSAYWSVFTRMKEEPCPPEDTWPEWLDVAHNNGKCAALAPVFDMMNHHNTDYNCDWDHSNGAVITTLNDIKEGEELLINYGHEGNGELLSLYGFALENNQSPVVFTEDDLVEACILTQGLHQRVCKSRIEYFAAYFDVENVKLEATCETDVGDVKPFFVGDYDEGDKAELASAQIRWGMFVSQLMKKRRNELKELESKLGRDEKMRGSPFVDLLKSVYASENSILKECVTTFKNHLAADLEVFFNK